MEILREIELADGKGVIYMVDKNLKYKMGGNNMINATATANGMNEVQKVFNYEGQKVRTVIIDGEPWFVARDVCNVLELVKVDRAVAGLDEDEKGTHTVSTPGGKQRMTVINESGVYALIMISRKPEAKTFKKWVTQEVLPSIRKTGVYGMPDAVKEYLAMSVEDQAIAFFTKQKDVKFLEAENKLLKPKAGKYEEFLNSDGLFDWDAISSILNIGRNTMLFELRERGYLQKTKDNNWNLAIRRYEEAGWFVTKATSHWKNNNGVNIPRYRTFVTPIGLDKFIGLFKKCDY